MRTVAFVAALALLSVALAGCSGEDPERYPDGVPTSTSRSRSATGTASGSSTSTTGSPDNQPPTAGLAIQSINGTNVTFALTGADPDADPLAWQLQVGNATESGKGLPANVTRSFAAGNHSANLTVSDGTLFAWANLTFSINGTGGPTGIPATYTFTGTALGAHEPLATGAGTGSTITHTFAVFGPVAGLRAFLSWEPGAPGVDLDLYINDPSGEERGSSACFHAQPAPFPLGCNRGADEEVVLTLSGAAETGDWTAEVVPYESPNASYTLEISFT
jgi:hypothetical protein